MKIVEKGEWPKVGWAPFGFCGPQLGAGPTGENSFTVGFLGFGRIAQATLARLIPFGVTRAIYTDSGRGSRSADDDAAFLRKYESIGQLRSLERASLDELAQQSDLVILLAPGEPFCQQTPGNRAENDVRWSSDEAHNWHGLPQANEADGNPGKPRPRHACG